jgi:subtilisin-like proprotein convertase family protein
MKKIFFLFLIISPAILIAQTFNGTGGGITDDNVPNNFNLNVSGVVPAIADTNYGLVTACINITHTYDSDLRIQLIAPDGTIITLVDGAGGGNDDFTGTCFNYTASTSIMSGSAPFTGTYKSMGRMGNVNNGQNPNGTWILRITDTYASDVGTLLNWSLTFGPNAQGPAVFAGTNLPLIVINTYGGTIVDDPKINANMRIIDNGVLNHVNDSADYNGEIGIEIRGNYSASLPQKPYGFETWTILGAQLDTNLLGMSKEHDWIFIANYNDKSFLRNPLSLKLFSEMGHYASRYKLCEVIINGEYQGVYCICESIKRDHNRVDIAKLDSSENSGLNVTGGYIWKNDFGNGWTSAYHPIDHPGLNINYAYHYPKEQNITPQQANYIEAFVNTAEQTLYGSNWLDTVNGYRKYLSVNSFYDYFIVNTLARNGDGFKKSVYFHKDIDQLSGIAKIKMGPVWDFDWAWKNLWDCYTSGTDGSGWTHLVNDCGPDNNSWGWYVRLLQDTTFANELNCRWKNYRLNLLDTTRIFNWIDSNETTLNGAQVRHYETWPILGAAVGAPENDSFPDTYHGEMAKFKMWIRKRVIWLDDNMFGNGINCQYTSVESSPSQLQAHVFPNPASEIVYVELPPGEKGYEISLMDQSGRMIRTNISSFENITVIDVNTLSSGIYFVRIRNSEGYETSQKIIVHH